MACEFRFPELGISANELRISPRDPDLFVDSNGGGYRMSSSGVLSRFGSRRGAEQRRRDYLTSNTPVDFDEIRRKFAILRLADKDTNLEGRDRHLHQVRRLDLDDHDSAERVALTRLGFRPDLSREAERKIGDMAVEVMEFDRILRISETGTAFSSKGPTGLSYSQVVNAQKALVRASFEAPASLTQGMPLPGIPNSYAKLEPSKGLCLYPPLAPLSKGGFGAISVCTMLSTRGQQVPCVFKEATVIPSSEPDAKIMQAKVAAHLENEENATNEIFSKHASPPVRGPILDKIQTGQSHMLVLPLMNGTLRTVAKESTHEVRQTMINKFISILGWWFSNPYFHGDIKPDNILENNGELFFADLGTWRNLNDNAHVLKVLSCGTPSYRALEDYLLLNRCNHVAERIRYFRQIDQFASSVVMFSLLSKGNLPYKHAPCKLQDTNLGEFCQGPYQAEFLKHIHPKGQKLMQQMLELDPRRRIPFAEAVHIIQADPHIFSFQENPTIPAVEVPNEEITGTQVL